MRVSEKLACMFSSWYAGFRDVTIESRVLSVPSDVLEYLMSDGTLVLPAETSTHSCNGRTSNDDYDSDDNDDDDDDNDWDEAPHAETEPEFPEFFAKVQQYILELGGSVMPKLNWSAPRDAKWVSYCGSLQCRSLNEILLLLKSSEFVTHDLVQPFQGCSSAESTESDLFPTRVGVTTEKSDDCASLSNLSSTSTNQVSSNCVDNLTDNSVRNEDIVPAYSRGCHGNDSGVMRGSRSSIEEESCRGGVAKDLQAPPTVEYELVLRRWEEISEGEEFRCFVAGRRLLGVSQRDDSLYLPTLVSAMPAILRRIKRFFKHKILKRFPLDNFVFDVWCRGSDEMLLIDFNPYDRVTDSLLFTWEELEVLAANRETVEVETRCVEEGLSQAGGGVTTCPMRRYAMPVDLIDLTTGSDMDKFIDLMKLNDGGIQTGPSPNEEEEE